MFIDPQNPVYNAIIFYILIVSIILIIKPSRMYCYKNKKFKSFGFNENQTLISFSVVTTIIGIFLYMFFLWIEIIYKLIIKNKKIG